MNIAELENVLDCSNAVTMQPNPPSSKIFHAEDTSKGAYINQHHDFFHNSKFFTCKMKTCTLLKQGCKEPYPTNGNLRMQNFIPWKIYAHNLG